MRAGSGVWAVTGVVVAASVGAIVYLSWEEEIVREVVVPELSEVARAGERAFDRACARCHGEQARGGPEGPPLVHVVYRPGHHADVAFELAVRRGVRAHHWQYGDMPAQPEVTPREIAEITRYVRELQKANGID